MIVSYLGPRKTYSEEVARITAVELGEADIVPRKSLDEVASSIALGIADYAVMAYYNVIEGVIVETMPLIALNRLSILDVKELGIVLNIGAYPGSKDLSRVYSHPKALGQCSDYLNLNYPDVERVESLSTAAGAERVGKECSGLAIGRKEALIENGLEVIAENIGNKISGRENATYFFVVGK